MAYRSGLVRRERIEEALREGDIRRWPAPAPWRWASTFPTCTVILLQGRYQLGKVQLLFNLDQQVVGIDEIPQLFAGELEQDGVLAGPVQRFDSLSSDQVVPQPGYCKGRRSTFNEAVGLRFDLVPRTVGGIKPTTGAVPNRGALRVWYCADLSSNVGSCRFVPQWSHVATGQRAIPAIFELGWRSYSESGAEGRIRTTDTGIFSAVLYQAELPRLKGV